MSPTPTTIDDVAALLGRYRFRYQDEAQLQRGVADALDQAGIAYVREHKLGADDRPDFYLEGPGLVIEIKCRESLPVALRQVRRYMAHDTVRGVILAAGRAWGRRGIVDRADWGSKPITMVFLRRAM